MRIYVDSMRKLYATALLQNGEIYDIAFGLTDGFRRITGHSVGSDTRIIRILRYVVAPTFSQMKFGQLFGFDTMEKFERARIVSSQALEKHATLFEQISVFVNENLDRDRFVWLSSPMKRGLRALAEDFARKWTCSLVSDQGAQTAYRNWRKQQQEAAIERHLIHHGYIRSAFVGTVRTVTDVPIGEYTRETKVRGISTQKADFVVRRRRDGKLLLIEAKAVGVALDAFKRVKECCDKAHSWYSSPELGAPLTVAVLGGFFAETNIHALRDSGVEVAWEFDLSTLDALV